MASIKPRTPSLRKEEILRLLRMNKNAACHFFLTQQYHCSPRGLIAFFVRFAQAGARWRKHTQHPPTPQQDQHLFRRCGTAERRHVMSISARVKMEGFLTQCVFPIGVTKTPILLCTKKNFAGPILTGLNRNQISRHSSDTYLNICFYSFLYDSLATIQTRRFGPVN